MEAITIGQIAGAITLIGIIGGFIIKIFLWWEKSIIDRFTKIEERMNFFESKEKTHDLEINDSKEEMLILLKGQLACLKGLSEQGCNGPVTQSINEIEIYLLNQAHK